METRTKIGAVIGGAIGLHLALAWLLVSPLKGDSRPLDLAATCRESAESVNQAAQRVLFTGRVMDTRIGEFREALELCMNTAKGEYRIRSLRRAHCVSTDPELQRLDQEIERLQEVMQNALQNKYFRMDDAVRCRRGAVYS